MATESVNPFEALPVPSSGEGYSIDGLVHLDTSGAQENDNLDLLNDFESYVEEINDRLKIFRVVNDSVVKAVLEEATEMIAMKELQVTALKEQLLEGQMAQFDGNKRILCSDKLKQVSSICKDLEAVQKSLSNLEQLSTHGSLESDYFHRRVSLWERNGSNEESTLKLPENFESFHLKHMPPVQLYSHLREMIVKIKRDHETNVQAMTEDYFSLKREFLKERELLKERGYFLPHKSKDFDMIRKIIPDVISKLNDIVTENEDFSEICDLSRDQYNNLLMENRSLRDMLNDREREVTCLCSHVSETEERLTQKQNFLSEAHLTKQIEDLKTSLDGARIEASLSEEVYNGIISDLAHQIKCEEEGNNLKSITALETLELVYREALYDTKAKMSSEYFSNMQTIMAQEISGVIYQEVLKDMGMQLNNSKEKCLEMDKLIVSLESEASDMKNVLASQGEEKHNLEQNILKLETLVEEKIKLQNTEKHQYDKELSKMMDHISKQGVKLKQSLQQVHILTETLQKAELDSNTAILQERENASLLIDKKDREYKEQIISVIHAVQELRQTFEGFELEAAQSTKFNQLRLEGCTLQLKSLKRKAKLLRTAELCYKEKLERRCSDLQKAEAEVDVLGDEVETLLGLLEKIHVALDHYSPVLQHYPGIMEILKLVQRELNVVSTKSGSRTP